jgi:glucuronate isomerase
MLNPDRLFDPEPIRRALARKLYETVKSLPIVSPHGHVDARFFAEPSATFGSPADLFIIPDHYVFRMLYSQGIPLESLGIPPSPLTPLPNKEMGAEDGVRVEIDHRKIWHLFCSNFHLFRGTPSGIWLTHELDEVFGIDGTPSAANADQLYDAISEKLSSPDYSPRKLFERFNIKVLATTNAATDPLTAHQQIRASGWPLQQAQGGARKIIPTFRPDALVNLLTPGWRDDLSLFSQTSGMNVVDYVSFVRALEERRRFFKSMGATATDHAAESAQTEELSPAEAEIIFQRALKGQVTPADAARFTAHMLIEMARMSVDDGLVMQLHVGSLRNHNDAIVSTLGADKGADIPVQTEFTHSLRPLLNKFGNDSRLTLILFTLDETTYARELAPLAGHYPAVKLGPPWWFHDSPNGMRRYFDQVLETAGLYNTVGFNDDTRAFCSIPARHNVWRRVSCDWLAGLVLQGRVDEADAFEMASEMAVGLARKAYKLGE